MYSVAILLFSTASLFAGQQSSSVQALMAEGAEAYRQAHFKQAAEAFRKAVEQEPSNLEAHLDLAGAYMVQYIPGFDSEENQQNLTQATAEYNAVLQLDPSNNKAILSLAQLDFNSAAALRDQAQIEKLDEAADLFRRLASVDPINAEAYYYQGVIAWSRFLPAYSQARIRAGMRPEDSGPLPDTVIRQQLSDKYGRSIDEGLTNLNKALAINPDNTDAMSYMNLLLRERAVLRSTQAESDQDIEQAEEWTGKALEARQRLSHSPVPRISTVPPVPSEFPPPPPGQEASPFKGIRIGPDVAKANLVKKVTAVYPQLAKSALVQGVVRFEVAIGTDGTVRAMQLLAGILCSSGPRNKQCSNTCIGPRF